MASKHMLTGQGPGLYEFLIEAELQQYYNALKTDLKVQTVAQLKYVTDADMCQIGMARPEMRRLVKYFNKHCPQTYLGKMKKKLLYRKDDGISVASLVNNSQNVAGRSSRTGHVAPGRHIIQADSIVIHKKLGSGEFGTVQQGVWTSDDGERIQVAIKCLTQERMENNPVEFLKEAAIMHSVDHEHIVRLYGVVLDTSALMLVTELAPLRSLLEFIKEPSMRPNLMVPTLFDFAVQICDGMQYLESKRLIHRDLAARNILVFSKKLVKISDFGLSRALGVGKDYYQTNFNVNLKLPIAWCAPECINFLRFTSASDVWAYGVTLWEIFSYGFQPWAALTGQQILEAIDEPNYQRLEKPECCSNELYYQLMLKCWQHNPTDRPNFAQIAYILPECKPEQVQAIRDSDAKPRRDCLEYKTGDVIVVLEKNPAGLHSTEETLWKGVLKCGRTGLFNPGNTITYIGSSLPSLADKTTGHFKRNDSRSSSLRKSRLSTDMISGPQGDLQHTGHVGCDGEIFGDLTFLGSKNWAPKQVVRPYRPDSSSSINTNNSSSGRAQQQQPRSKVTRDNEMPSSDTAPLLRQASESSQASRRRPAPLSLINTNDPDHEYHEISDEENDTGKNSVGGLVNPAQSPLDSPAFEKPFDLGPSLVDEVFEALHEDLQSDEAHNVKNELREMARQKKKFATVKPISSSDRRTLDHAIKIANELASKSMLDLDCSGKHSLRNTSLDDISSPKTPTSPSYRRKFAFILGSKNDREKRNYSQEAASIPDIQSTLTEEAKEAYNSLIEKTGSMGILTPSPLENKPLSFQYPERRSTSNCKNLDIPEETASLTPKEQDTKNTGNTEANNIVNPPSAFEACVETNSTQEESQKSQEESAEEEEDQNPLRLLRMNRPGNILPLPPRDRKKPQQILADRLSIRHQRKHQLLVFDANPPPPEAMPRPSKPPLPPPKPQRQSRTIAAENHAEIAESTLPTAVFRNSLDWNIVNKDIGNFDKQATNFADNLNLQKLFSNNSTSKCSDNVTSTGVRLYENYESEEMHCDKDDKIDSSSSEFVNSNSLFSTSQLPPELESFNGNNGTASCSSKESTLTENQIQPNKPSQNTTHFLANNNNNCSATESAQEAVTKVNQNISSEYSSPMKVKIVQRILGSTATEEEACWALEMTCGDRAKAVKLLRLKSLLPESLLTDNISKVVSVLADVHWDVARASEFLLDSMNKNHGFTRKVSKPLESVEGGNSNRQYQENFTSTTNVPESQSATASNNNNGSFYRPSHV